MIRLKKPEVSKEAEFGEGKKTYTLIASVWAKVSSVAGRESFIADQIVAEELTEFKIRYRSDINAQWIIEYNDDVYDLVAPPQELGRREGLKIIARVNNP